MRFVNPKIFLALFIFLLSIGIGFLSSSAAGFLIPVGILGGIWSVIEYMGEEEEKEHERKMEAQARRYQ